MVERSNGSAGSGGWGREASSAPPGYCCGGGLMRRRLHEWVAAVVSVLLLLVAGQGWAQEREHFQLKVGATYDQGDFGTSSTTRTLFVPVTVKYLGERFDLGVTPSFVVVDTAGGVTLVEGEPTRTGTGVRRVINAGFGDTLVKGRFFLLDDPGPQSPLPALTPFAKVKIPTADRDRNLGTGETDYGFGLEFDKQLWRFLLFGDASYTVIGSPPGQDLRNRPAASLGAGFMLTNALTVGAFLDWRRALVRGKDDPTELVGFLTYKVTRTLSFTPNVFVGLTNGSPDFGVGFELAYKFGRF